MSETREIPNSREAEEALLGSVLIHPELYITLDIEPRDFYQARHQEIWKAFGEVEQIDYVSVSEYLKSKNKLAEIGGDSYITQLINSCVTSLHAEEYANIVRDYSRRRGLIQVANSMMIAAMDTSKEIQGQTGDFVNSIIDASRSNDGAIPLIEIVRELSEEIERKSKDPKDIWGIETGFPGFDKVTGGIQKKEITLLSGEPGVGKSMLAMQMGMNMGKKLPGAIYSMEMGNMQLARRMISGLSQIPTRSLKTGWMKDSDWASLVMAEDMLSYLPIYVSDSSGWTTTSLRADIARLKAQHQIEWFVLDYLYLLNDGAGSDEIERTALASKGLKQICKDLDMAGIVVHSMNKSQMGIDGTPGNQSLRGSGQVIYDADMIIYLTKYIPSLDDDYSTQEKENMRTLTFGKGRELESIKKYIHLVKQPLFPLFGELDKIG